MRKTLISLLVFIATYSGIWFYSAHYLEAIVLKEIESLQTQGYQVHYDALKKRGFPFQVLIQLARPSLTYEKAFDGRTAGSLRIGTYLWQPLCLRLDVDEVSFVQMGSALLHGKEHTTMGRLTIGQIQGFYKAQGHTLTFRDITFKNPLVGVEAHMKSLDCSIAHTRPPRLTVDIRHIGVGALQGHPFGNQIQKCSFTIKRKKDFRKSRIVQTAHPVDFIEIMKDWAQSYVAREGTLEIPHFQLQWGKLYIEGNAEIPFDQKTQPMVQTKVYRQTPDGQRIQDDMLLGAQLIDLILPYILKGGMHLLIMPKEAS